MSHLGQRISALIDGELSDSERDRAWPTSPAVTNAARKLWPCVR